MSDKISKFPVKEGEKGSLIKKNEISEIKFSGIKEIIDKYLELKT